MEPTTETPATEPRDADAGGVLGIHHVTAIATDPQRNVDFYTGVLGLRMVKRSVNMDDPGTHHFYYGDESGRPGTILTFFPWPLARRGSRGTGQATVTAFAVPEGSLGWWLARLEAHGVPHDDPAPRFDEEVLAFLDPDGLKLELVTDSAAAGREPWAAGPVPGRYAVRGFHSVTLTVDDGAPTAELLTGGMGMAAAGEQGERFRFAASGGGAGDPGTLVDVVADPSLGRGQVAAGTVHHVAWRVPGDREELELREALIGRGLGPTPVVDRHYFRSVYFREPGGVLFEIATDPPGFTVDEPVAELGSALRLPPWLEPQRARIEAALPPIEVPAPAAAAAAEEHGR
jgi:glyoxalase family protein